MHCDLPIGSELGSDFVQQFPRSSGQNDDKFRFTDDGGRTCFACFPVNERAIVYGIDNQRDGWHKFL